MNSRLVLGALLLALGPLGCRMPCLQVSPPQVAGDFFPLRAASRWEYEVRHFPGKGGFKFVAVVKGDRYIAAAGKRCRVVDETYSGFGLGIAHPVAYCRRDGFIDRIMSIEYRGDDIQDTGLKSVEYRFLPVALRGGVAWEGLTNAYELPDGSAYIVRQTHRAVIEAEPIEVPAGRFVHCLRVETRALHNAKSGGRILQPTVIFYYVDWYAPGVGLIKTRQTARYGDPQPISEMELLSYWVSPDNGPGE